MILSRTLHKMQVRLKVSNLIPAVYSFFKNEVILALTQSCGNTPSLRDLLNNSARCEAMISASSLSKHRHMYLIGPTSFMRI